MSYYVHFLSVCVCMCGIFMSKEITDLEALVTFPSLILPDQTVMGLMVLVPLRSMQISSTLFRHVHWEATNRNQREAALTLARAPSRREKENQRLKIWRQVSPV